MLTCENSIDSNNGFNYCCNVSDIAKLNETKRYTILASELISEICRDVRLTASSVKLWHYLYVRASLTTKLEISISYNELSVTLNKSLRTISRYIATLKKYGYLLIKNNYNKNGQTINTFYIRLPKLIINRVQETKDRSKNIQKIIKESSDFVISNEFQHKNNIPNDTADVCEDNNLVQNNVNNDLTNDFLENYSNITKLEPSSNTSVNKDEMIKIYESLRRESAIECTKEVIKMNQRREAKFDVPRYDKYGVHKTTTINSLLNNNNSARPTFCGTLDMIDKQNRNVIFNTVNKLTRTVNYEQKNKILKTLISIGFREHESLKVTEEIIFAIEHDSLREKPVNHAINIALKLVKQRRWTTPCKMRNQ